MARLAGALGGAITPLQSLVPLRWGEESGELLQDFMLTSNMMGFSHGGLVGKECVAYMQDVGCLRAADPLPQQLQEHFPGGYFEMMRSL